MPAQPTDNTLNIRPIPTFGGGHNGQTNAGLLHGVRDPKAAEDARARIAGMVDVHEMTPSQTLVTPSQTTLPSAVDFPLPQVAPREHAEHTPTKGHHKTKSHPKLPSRVKPIATAIGSFFLLLILFKSQVIISQIKYLSAKTSSSPSVVITPATADVGSASVMNIPKINVSAPVVYVPTNDEAAVQKGLEGGVVHYANTPTPGQPGNTVIVGHSSNDWWEPGNYKFVFVLLDKLAPGDTMSVNYESKKYVYQVTEVKVVEPTDISVLAPTPEPTLTIITCTPPGTSWKRLIVKAKQISPDPSGIVASPVVKPSATGALPGSAPTWWDQIQGLWQRLLGQPSSPSTTNSSPSSTTATPSTTSTSLPGAK